jgi:hypothetical protein
VHVVAGGAHPKGLPRASRSFLSASAGSASGPAASAVEDEAEAEQRQLRFLAWLSKTLLDSLYPGEPEAGAVGIWMWKGYTIQYALQLSKLLCLWVAQAVVLHIALKGVGLPVGQ